mgnify:CR=1 FL=1
MFCGVDALCACALGAGEGLRRSRYRAPLCAVFLEYAELLHVDDHLGVARALGSEVRCRANAVALEPCERLGEPFEIREVAELHCRACELCYLSLACVCEMPHRPQREPAHERHAPVAEPQALARDAPGGVVREREHPVATARLCGVVLDIHAQALEEPFELALAPRDGARYADAGADVRYPGVAALLGNLALCL